MGSLVNFRPETCLLNHHRFNPANFQQKEPVMQLISIQIGKPQTLAPSGSNEWWDKEWTTALSKMPTTEPVWLGYEGLLGDGVADTKAHGGVDRAVCAYPAEHYAYWRPTLHLPDLPYGAFGENFTVNDLLEDSVCIGDVYAVGEARVQISQPRQPCWKPARRWKIKDLTLQIEVTGRTGFYFRILKHGLVQAGQTFTRIERRHPEWTIARCNDVYYRQKEDLAAALALSECISLSGGWKDMLHTRYRQGNPAALIK